MHFLNELKIDRLKIIQFASAGNKNAAQIITLHRMYVRLPELGSLALCEAFYRNWKSKTDTEKPSC